MNTINGLTQILLQVFLILFPILLYHLYWGERDVLGERRKSQCAYGVMSLTSIILCMFFTFPVSNGYLLDLRAVPLLISFLYGGRGYGLLVTVVFLVYRYYLSGGGLLIPLLTCSFLIPFLIGIIPHYNKASNRHKVFLATVIALFTSLFIAVATCTKLVWSNIPLPIEMIQFFIGYTIIQTATVWITVSLIESLREKVIIQHQLHKSDQLNLTSELAASVAHEIRNPLTVIRGFMQLFNENKQIPPDVKPYVGLVITEIDRTQEIITNFLSFAKPKLERIEKISVADHVRHLVDLMYSYAIVQRVHVTTSIADTAYIKTDPDKFSQVLMNVMKNGIEAMPDGGELKVRVSEVKEMVVISVEDHGVGMTQEEIEHLGEPFYSTKTKGTGIGLMVSYRLVEKMNGRIEIQSKKGVGTRFSIKIPKAAKELE
ncbi:HAMP domain-containing histidine kinase [Aneurinibacillus sp. BA2021]|nr:HAMP domain-containing histidine kinase [Aneurinibacillus sp. BA2021]